ncbi:hypothetical protein PUR61_41175 [Streptomyces sp. BE20]|uniref:hypothetical protein n=1 Tax=Streptomyces sp. BE20 TaxID=3002525 RepID=UPI002E7716B7|nr:hypothetical protein [Streptomyces sp. BE20]MEE1828536.1 hypothetical protein [Streptomyces sp. BE20]
MALAAPAPAGAEDTEPAVVVNGTFSSPTVPSNEPFASGIDGWTGGGRVSATRAAHRLGIQAAYVPTGSIRTRLRGVRTGATVTLSWDDSPDACAAAGLANRTYTISVAGTANSPGAFTTNPSAGRTDWFLGRTYSFTAAEDAPQITFTGTSTERPNCTPLITNVAAKQTAPPLDSPPTPQQNDPCAGEAASSPQCSSVADNKGEIDKCPPSNKECLASVAGDGKAEKDGIAKETQAVEDFGKIPRDQDPNTAASQLCALPNALTADVKPGDAVVPPSDWWLC